MNLKQYFLSSAFDVQPDITASFVYLEQDGKILGVQRKNGTFGFPGGKVEPNETSRKSAIREFLEETGKNIENLCVTPFRYFVDGKIVDVYCASTKQTFEDSWIGPEGTECKLCTPEEICQSYPEFNLLTIFNYGSKKMLNDANMLILDKAFPKFRKHKTTDKEFISLIMSPTIPILETFVENLVMFNPSEANRLIQLIDVGIETKICDESKNIDEFFILLKKYVSN